MRQSGQPRGFTLIEVLVALGIVALALMAGMQATAALSRNADRQTLAMLAQVCADNELGRLKLQRQLPNTGDTVVPCEQASRAMSVTLSVQPTPNPNFRRVDAQVQEGDVRLLTVSTVMGRN
jgi:general secretion pathway protein I